MNADVYKICTPYLPWNEISCNRILFWIWTTINSHKMNRVEIPSLSHIFIYSKIVYVIFHWYRQNYDVIVFNFPFLAFIWLKSKIFILIQLYFHLCESNVIRVVEWLFLWSFALLSYWSVVANSLLFLSILLSRPLSLSSMCIICTARLELLVRLSILKFYICNYINSCVYVHISRYVICMNQNMYIYFGSFIYIQCAWTKKDYLLLLKLSDKCKFKSCWICKSKGFLSK